MTQTERLLELLKDHQPHRTDEILLKVYGSQHMGIARIGARIADLKNLGHTITGYHDPRNRKLYIYKLIPPVVPELPPAFEPKTEASATLF
jgi:tetrahydromethanopterin S-methyltransferase subunit D